MCNAMEKLDLSIVVPLYNEAESLPELVAWIDRVARANNLSYEAILVDDGSKDGSWKVIESLRRSYPAVRGIGFTASRPPSTAASRRPAARWSSRWMPTCRIRPTRFPPCVA